MLFVADSAKERIIEVLNSENKSLTDYFVRVSVTSGGCSGLSYKLDFDNDLKPTDQVFEDKGIRMVTDLRSFLYVHNTILEFSGGLALSYFGRTWRNSCSFLYYCFSEVLFLQYSRNIWLVLIS